MKTRGYHPDRLMDLLGVLVERSIRRWRTRKESPRWRHLRRYFKVKEEIVVAKLWLVMGGALFSPSFKRVPRGRSRGVFLDATADVNAPELYVPLMAASTLVISSTLISALSGAAVPVTIERVSLTVVSLLSVELLLIKLLFFIMERRRRIRWLDLLSYLGYMFVPTIIVCWSRLLGHVEFVLLSWLILAPLYCLFLYRTLWGVLGENGGVRLLRSRDRLVWMVCVIQPIMMLALGSS